MFTFLGNQGKGWARFRAEGAQQCLKRPQLDSPRHCWLYRLRPSLMSARLPYLFGCATIGTMTNPNIELTNKEISLWSTAILYSQSYSIFSLPFPRMYTLFCVGLPLVGTTTMLPCSTVKHGQQTSSLCLRVPSSSAPN